MYLREERLLLDEYRAAAGRGADNQQTMELANLIKSEREYVQQPSTPGYMHGCLMSIGRAYQWGIISGVHPAATPRPPSQRHLIGIRSAWRAVHWPFTFQDTAT